MKQNIEHYIRAGYAGIYIVTHEEERVDLQIGDAVKAAQFNLLSWTSTDGLVDPAKPGTATECDHPVELCEQFGGIDEKTVVIAHDMHLYFEDCEPELIRAIKNTLMVAKRESKSLIITGCRRVLPPELEKLFVVIDLALPTAEEMAVPLQDMADAQGIELTDEDRRAITEAASGMTFHEFQDAMALSYVSSKLETGEGCFDPMVIAHEKSAVIRKSGLLELIKPTVSLEDLGGLDAFKGWVMKRRRAFSPEAKKYGLPSPKGCLGIPLLKLDMGRIFAGIVGESEANVRKVIQLAEAVAPCVLFIDELDKGFAGMASGTDSGAGSRVLATILDWMSSKTAPVFVFATANDIARLANERPELVRRGRWDELWFVDLPNEKERKEIWKIQIAKHGRKPGNFDLVNLARLSEGWTGSEIESVIVDALMDAFDRDKELDDMTISMVAQDLVPLSQSMKSSLDGLRNWAKGRARPATTPTDNKSSGRKLVA